MNIKYDLREREERIKGLGVLCVFWIVEKLWLYNFVLREYKY